MTINFIVATFFQCVFIDFFSLHLLQQNFKCCDKVFLSFALFFVTTELSSVVTFFLPLILSFVAIFISMSRQNSSAYSGALLMQCRDNTSAFRLSLWCNIFLVLLLILCHDRAVKCCDIISTVILHSTLSLLRYSSACCNKLLQIALGFLPRQSFITSRNFSFSCLSHFCCFFYYFLFF